MNAEAVRKLMMTPDEYLAMERSSLEKHEYCDGEVFAMAGASKEHNLIVGNVVTALNNALRRRPCEVYPSDMRVKIPATGLYTYPDASVACHRPAFEDDTADTLLNPQVIVEVLSDSTEDYDRGTKFKNYRTIPSFVDYVLVSQAEVLVEHHVRQPDGSWLMREHRAGGRVELVSIGCGIDVDDLYLKVFSAAGPALPA
jgi:Uma2 family endonuclease